MLQISRRQSRLSGNPHLTAMFVQGRTGSGRQRQSRPQTWSHLRAPVYFCRCLYPQESWGGAFQTRPCSLHPLRRITGHIPVRQGCPSWAVPHSSPAFRLKSVPVGMVHCTLTTPLRRPSSSPSCRPTATLLVHLLYQQGTPRGPAVLGKLLPWSRADVVTGP